MNTHCIAVMALSVWMFVSCAHAGTGKPAPKFYAYCVEAGVKGLTPRPLAEQAKLLREIGFDGAGVALSLDDSFETSLKTLDDAGLQLYLTWASLNVQPGKPACDPRLPAAIARLKGRPTTVSVLTRGLKPGDPAGMEPAVKILRELGDAAAAAGVRISIYNHVNDWTESLPFIIRVLKRVNHPQVGFNFNLCHWLKVDGDKDYRPLLRENAARLFCVTLCGAQKAAQTWTHGLIQPLDKGDFDNRALLAALDEIGYRGPVGLMCYGVPDDARDHLTRSMKVWKSWHSK